ncbi:MAG: protein kinase [Planctomycetota bacterium]
MDGHMSDRGDALFIEMAVAKGYLDRARAEEALSTERATEEDGAGRRFLRDILADEGWMTKGQIIEVEAEIENGSTHTGRIAGYRVLSKIGRGGMGTVYKAEREETGELVALKVLPRKMAERGDFVERFLREARAASKIKSEHIVKTVDVGFSGGYYYFAMEYVEGESVDTTISIDGAMDELKATHIAHQMALALRDAEQAGIVHRDIKPGNVIVAEDGLAKLTDFGLARGVTDDSTTQAGLALGTPNYMSPEQARAAGSLDVRSDIYSLGVTFYHMVTGAVPFHGETSLLTMLKHLNEQPVAPMTRRPGLSQGCNDVILKMLAKDRADRYRTAADLVTDLALVMEGKPPQYAESAKAAPGSAEEKPGKAPTDAGRFAQEMRRHGRVRWLKTGTTAFLFLLVGIVVYSILFTGGEPNRKQRSGGPVGQDKPDGLGSRERAARAALAGAKRFAADNPDEFVAIAARFAAAEKDHKRSSVHEEAERLRAEAQARLESAVRAALKSCDQAAEALAKQGRFSEAISAYGMFPDSLRTPEALDRIRRARLALEQRAEAQAGELLANARRVGVERKKAAPALWELVRGHAHTPFYARHHSEIEKLLIEAETGHLAVDALLVMKAAALEGGVSEFVYDFRSPEQSHDWPTVWRERSLGRWPIQPGYGEMTAESGLAFFKVPFRGEFSVEINAKDLRAASIRFGMPAPSSSPATSGYSFEWKRSGAGAVSTVSHAGTQLDRQRQLPRSRVIGTVKLGLEVKGGMLTARAGDRLAHRVRITAPRSPGYLVLAGFNFGARLTGLTVRCKLDRDWLQKELVDPARSAKIESIRWEAAPRIPLLKGGDPRGWSLSAPGHWTFAEGHATASRKAECVMTTGSAAWRDYVFSAKVLPGAAPGAARMLFRWTGDGAGRGYYVELAAGAGKVTLHSVKDGKAKTLAESSVKVSGAEWYDVMVEARGKRIRVWLRGQEVLVAEDGAYAAGGVGLASVRSGARFGDIVIKVAR